eukprot:365243-Chlamydomonas_euryale.AAC.18
MHWAHWHVTACMPPEILACQQRHGCEHAPPTSMLLLAFPRKSLNCVGTHRCPPERELHARGQAACPVHVLTAQRPKAGW